MSAIQSLWWHLLDSSRRGLLCYLQSFVASFLNELLSAGLALFNDISYSGFSNTPASLLYLKPHLSIFTQPTREFPLYFDEVSGGGGGRGRGGGSDVGRRGGGGGGGGGGGAGCSGSSCFSLNLRQVPRTL